MKAGWKTSEHGLALVAIILGALVAANVFPEGSLSGKLVGAAVIALASLGYSLSRGLAKAHQPPPPPTMREKVAEALGEKNAK